MHSRWTSRKFLIAVATIAFVAITQIADVDIDGEAYWTIIGTAIAYITGEALVDSRKP